MPHISVSMTAGKNVSGLIANNHINNIAPYFDSEKNTSNCWPISLLVRPRRDLITKYAISIMSQNTQAMILNELVRSRRLISDQIFWIVWIVYCPQIFLIRCDLTGY